MKRFGCRVAGTRDRWPTSGGVIVIKQVRKNRKSAGPTSEEPVGAFSWDMVSNRVSSDAEVARLFGIDAELMAEGLPVERLIAQIHLKDRARVAKSIHEAILDGSLYQERYRVMTENGGFHWVFSVGRCFGYTDGLPILWTGFVCEVAAPDGMPEDKIAAADNVVKFKK